MSRPDPVNAASSETGARPVMLVRFRSGVSGEAARSVHLLPSPVRTGAVSTLCGAALSPEQIETVAPGQGMPCSLCLLAHLSGLPDPGGPVSLSDADGGAITAATAAGRLGAAARYRGWGWPVTLRHGQIWLHLDEPVLALVVPTVLAAAVVPVLAIRRCPVPVLAHPHLPGHRILLGAEPYGLELPWPPGVHRVSGAVPLPSTRTPLGLVSWVCPPADGHPLQRCREIDIFGALHSLGAIGGGS